MVDAAGHAGTVGPVIDTYIPVPVSGALFTRDPGGEFVPTLLTQGPWSPEHQFGGAPAALLAELVEDVPTLAPMRVARLTVDLLRPVPIAALTARTDIRRQGKRLQLVEASLCAGGLEVARAVALRLSTAPLAYRGTDPGQPMTGPPAVPCRPGHRGGQAGAAPGMHEAIQYAYAREAGMWVDPTWVRLTADVRSGTPASPLARLAYTADCASAFGHPPDAPLQGINADITLSVVRYSSSHWLCMTGDGWTAPDGIGVARSVISDEHGVVATVAVSRLVEDTA